MCRLRHSPTEVARTPLVAMRWGSRSAAEEVTGHKDETIGWRLRSAAARAERITEALAHDLPWTAVGVD